MAIHTTVSLGFGGWLNGELLMFAMLVALSDVEPAPARTKVAPRVGASASHGPANSSTVEAH